MNNILKKVSVLLVSVVALSSCTDYYDKMNTSPNSPSPESVDPSYQLAAIQNGSLFRSNEYQEIQQLTPDHFAEYIANDILSSSQYVIDDRYITNMWNKSYTHLASINNIIATHGAKPEQTNIVQMAKIWKVWLMLRLTDYLGDIPYISAADGSGKPAAYDSQKDIYYTMFDQLREAITKFDATQKNPKTQDMLYGGDNAKWIKFANSLRLRMAVRISAVDAAKAKTEAEDAVSKGVMTSAADAASVKMGTSNAGIMGTNPFFSLYKFGGFNMCTAFERLVTGLGGQAWPTSVAATVHPAKIDPRAPIMFDPSSTDMGAEVAYAGRWLGTAPGRIEPGTSSVLPGGDKGGNVARFGKFLYSNASRRYPILAYSEVCFLQAQGVLLGWNMGGTAKSFYEAGVKDNMAAWSVPAGTADAYLLSQEPNFYGTTAAYDFNSGKTDTALDKIMTQKYLSHFIETSWEAWADHRRTHKPTLMVFEKISPNAFTVSEADRTNNTPEAYIKRGFYPSSEYTLNAENVKAAVARIGGKDAVNVNLWWDVK